MNPRKKRTNMSIASEFSKNSQAAKGQKLSDNVSWAAILGYPDDTN
jgi:hypothetical protein